MSEENVEVCQRAFEILNARRDTGDDVLMIGRLYARGRESGVEIDSATAWLSTLRDGRIVRARGYLDPKEVLEAAGLEE